MQTNGTLKLKCKYVKPRKTHNAVELHFNKNMYKNTQNIQISNVSLGLTNNNKKLI